MTFNSTTAVNGIEFHQVSKRYGEGNAPLVVKGIDFVVPKGTLTTLLGPSGCGKTTTLRMIAGLETVSGGQILLVRGIRPPRVVLARSRPSTVSLRAAP